MSYWSLRVSTRKVHFCFCKTVRDDGCKTAIVKKIAVLLLLLQHGYLLGLNRTERNSIKTGRTTV
jgi:hypothetical protein